MATCDHPISSRSTRQDSASRVERCKVCGSERRPLGQSNRWGAWVAPKHPYTRLASKIAFESGLDVADAEAGLDDLYAQHPDLG